MSEDLWPSDFGVITEKPPVAILREQGNALGARTKNIVVGRVETNSSNGDNRIQHVFFIYCPSLSFRVTFLAVYHGIDFYPAEIEQVEGEKKRIKVNSEEEFADALKEIFSTDGTKKLIASLIRQSEE